MNDNLIKDEFMSKWAKTKDDKIFMLFQDLDGNWRGATTKEENFVNVRAGDPNTVLTMLLTHDGQ